MLIVYGLAEKIKSGELKPGDRVPSVTELVGTCNVSPSTARRAQAKLKEIGLTDTVPGYATFVRFCRRLAGTANRRGVECYRFSRPTKRWASPSEADERRAETVPGHDMAVWQ
jgi:DNA-binding GntR family transcriptional regulator